jgi:hypothetical protein
MIKIMLTAEEMRQVKTLLDDKTGGGYANKINAIKVVRDASRHRTIDPFSGKDRPGVGLKEAKEAVEVLMADRGMTTADGTPAVRPVSPSGCIVPFQPIRSITVNMGGGDVTVDMDELSLKFSEGLTSLPLADVKRLFDLWQRIKDWEDAG